MREKSCFSQCDFIAHGWISGGAHAREKLLLSVRFYRARMNIGRCACARKVASLGTILSRMDGYRTVRMREKSYQITGGKFERAARFDLANVPVSRIYGIIGSLIKVLYEISKFLI